MNKQKVAIESLAMDLKRVSLGLQRGSLKMAERFKEEALKREEELEIQGIHDAYLQKLVENSKRALIENSERLPEDALMYSTLFQNFARKI